MSSTKTDYPQVALNGVIQGTLVVGQLFVIKELGAWSRSSAVKAGMTVLCTTTSAFLMHWLKKQSFYPDV